MEPKRAYQSYFPEDIREDVLYFGCLTVRSLIVVALAVASGGLLFAFMPGPIGFRLALFVFIPGVAFVLAVADLPRWVRRIQNYLREPAVRTVAGEHSLKELFPVQTGADDEPFFRFADKSVGVVMRVEPPPWETTTGAERLARREAFAAALRTAVAEDVECVVYCDTGPDLQQSEWDRRAAKVEELPSDGLRAIARSRLELHRRMAGEYRALRTSYHIRLRTRKFTLKLPGLHSKKQRKTDQDFHDPSQEKLYEVATTIAAELQSVGCNVYFLSHDALADLLERQLNPPRWCLKKLPQHRNQAQNVAEDTCDTGHGRNPAKKKDVRRVWYLGVNILVVTAGDLECLRASGAVAAKTVCLLSAMKIPTVLVDCCGTATAKMPGLRRHLLRLRKTSKTVRLRKDLYVMKTTSHDIESALKNAGRIVGRKAWLVVHTDTGVDPAILTAAREVWVVGTGDTVPSLDDSFVHLQERTRPVVYTGRAAVEVDNENVLTISEKGDQKLVKEVLKDLIAEFDYQEDVRDGFWGSVAEKFTQVLPYR
ncbi:MAG: TraC family protein [Peptococcaceae bacterium]|nr:TraC family protein [Peptococcaceae bacterium]